MLENEPKELTTMFFVGLAVIQEEQYLHVNHSPKRKGRWVRCEAKCEIDV